ncbi:hypothetical protein AB0J63_46430 [Streptosporangium canum]|uniref:hypothetical protein n=1 Tax=Streptosporangium canum TaxID=324952 RepID=UPI003441166F
MGSVLTMGTRGLHLTVSGAGFAERGGGLSMGAVPGVGITVSAALPAGGYDVITA